MSEHGIVAAATVCLSLLALGWLAATTGAVPALILACALAGMALLARRLHAASQHQMYLAGLLATTHSARPRLRLVNTSIVTTHTGRIH